MFLYIRLTIRLSPLTTGAQNSVTWMLKLNPYQAVSVLFYGTITNLNKENTMPETEKPRFNTKKIGDPQNISAFMQLFLSGVLFVLGAILSALLVMSTWSLINLVFVSHQISSSEILGAIVTWFLYFEFLALIAKYYQSGLHFPLRYFIYIGVTAIIRLIILYHDNPFDTLIFSLSILVLLLALYLANTKLLKRE